MGGLRTCLGPSIPQVSGAPHVLLAGRVLRMCARPRQENWTYTRLFTVTEDQLHQYKRQLLVAQGLDTVASVGINTNKVFRAKNMYRTYVWDVTDYIKEGSNTLQIAFTSAIAAANASNAAYAASAPPEGVPPLCPPAVQNGFCHVNFLRKSPCSFSWDWGPAFATQVRVWRV